ncbi:MAG: glycoside hydrolase family 47 protein [Marinifilaceae bacterium]
MIKDKKSIIFVLILGIGLCSGCNSNGRKTNSSFDKEEMADQVKSEFLHAWNGYKEYAWGMDELKPLSKSYKNWYDKSMLITPMDAFDTMVLMGLIEEAKEVKELLLSKLDFDRDIFVSTFETNLRFLGSLLSAYQLDGDPRFLDLAIDLANRLLPVFNTETGMPWARVNLKTGEVKGETSNPAEIGTLLLEFGSLSKLTGNPIYYSKAKKALVAVYQRRSKLGLVGTTLNIHTGEWLNQDAHLSGCIDSYYEYLLKAWLLFGDAECKEMWEMSIKGINKHLAQEYDGDLWYGHVDMHTGARTHSHFGALEASFPSVLALGGDLRQAQKLEESCRRIWKLYGVEPEQIDYRSKEVVWGHYFLRPGNLESAYYLYQYTRDEKYLKVGQEYFESLIQNCRTEVGYSELSDIVSKEKNDILQSFFFAETMKYLYLLFAPKETLNFREVIFNSEAHPIRKTWK